MQKRICLTGCVLIVCGALSLRKALGSQLLATTIHTLGCLLLTGTIACVVYKWLGRSLLRKAWLNLDLVRAVALIVSAGLTLSLF